MTGRTARARERAAELRWLAARLEMLGEPEPTPESHTQALTRAMIARAIRVMAAEIEDEGDVT